MPGFFRCQWCSGRGCIACDAERTKYEKAEAERVERARKMSPKAKLAELQDPLLRAIVKAEGPAAEARHEALIASVQAAVEAGHATMQDALDAEYARQFPNGPTPIFTARTDNPKDMALLRKVAGREAIESAFTAGGGGMCEVLANAEAARAEQDPPINYHPIGREE